ncbi:MAG: dihydrodipicolinate reductase [Deltaproteobacteria bacterium]|nr:MAG: dihydrodipicolinate reductase [Deltaproteobacteria bacterium]
MRTVIDAVTKRNRSNARALREVIRHPSLDLVGLLVYDPAKDGVDAGTLCGEEPVGVKATTDRAAIRALGADCVLYMPRVMDLADVVALLESGTNVVTTCGEFFDAGRPLGEERRAQVIDACAKGSASLYATGSSPGFITDALPLALLSMQRRVDSIEIDEFANLSRRDSPHMLFELMGFGRPVASFNVNGASAHLLRSFSPSLGVLAAAAGRPIDRWSSTGEVAVSRRTERLAAGELAAGRVAAHRTAIVGYHETWYCTTDTDPAWDLRPTGWRVRVRGDAPFDVAMPFPIPLEELGSHTPAYTANRPVNAIRYVCAAPPGILSTADLPPITPAGPPT